MKNLKIVLIAAMSLMFACQEEKSDPLAIDAEVAFAINTSNLKSSSLLKSTGSYILSDADKIILTIVNADGSPTKYTNYEVKIQQMNGEYFTQKIVLKTGNYKLTGFLIVDADNSTIFATPVVGSQEAQNVNNPLPLAFAVTKDISTSVYVEVLSTEKKKPEDFGLSRFPVVEIKTFDFMIGVADHESDNLLTANLTVSSGTYSYIQNLNNSINNVVTIREGQSNYTLTIEKFGYETFVQEYPIDTLKKYKSSAGNLPLLVDLKRLTVTDIDGNIYKTIVIGNQIWMAENLKVTRYRNGDAISDGTGIGSYSHESEPKYFFNYNDDVNNVPVYGRLYTWMAATDSRSICPAGWHLPTNEELIILENALGGGSVAGGKMKVTGTTYWDSPNTGATNESGFSCLPGGNRANGGGFGELGYGGAFWTATSTDAQYAWYYGCMSNNAAMFRYPGGTKKDGLSIRCIKD